MNTSKPLFLNSLANGIPVLPSGCENYYIQKCQVCLDSQGHINHVPFRVVLDSGCETVYYLEWDDNVCDQLRRAHADLVEATEKSACALAFLIVKDSTEYTIVEQAARGTSVDYYLAPDDGDDDYLIFNKSARLEVSGILKQGSERDVAKRIKEKIDRLKSDQLPAYIIVVEHGTPWAKVERV